MVLNKYCGSKLHESAHIELINKDSCKQADHGNLLLLSNIFHKVIAVIIYSHGTL